MLNRGCHVAALACLLLAASAVQAADRRELISEIGPNADKYTTTHFVAGEDFTDYKIDDKVYAYPTDGSPWGLHIGGPHQDGVTYTISWHSGDHTVGPNVQDNRPDTSKDVAYARVGTDKNGPWTQFTGEVINYVRTYIDAAHSDYNYLSPKLSHVIVTLDPRTDYYYQVSNDGSNWSDPVSFTTLATAKSGQKYPIKVGLIADVGQTASSKSTRDHLLANDPDMIILAGDFTYADNYGAKDPNARTGPNNIGGTNQQRWDSFQALWEPLFKKTPLVSCGGNHELETASIRAQVTPTTESFSYPDNYPFQAWSARWPSPGVTDNFGAINPAQLYHKTEFGGIATLISLNNYIPFYEGTKQYNWAKKAFASVDRKKTPWLIVQFHTPPYHTYQTHYKEQDYFLSVYEDMFVQYGVDLIINGHVHAYERTHPVYKYQKDECGPIYITIGDGGNTEGPYRNFVDETNPATGKSFCEGFDPNGLFAAGKQQGPGYQTASQPPSDYARTFTWQPASSSVDGKDGLVPKADDPTLFWCQSSQPTWSAYRDPSYGHAILTIKSEQVADLAWYLNRDTASCDDGNCKPKAADVTTLKRTRACNKRRFNRKHST